MRYKAPMRRRGAALILFVAAGAMVACHQATSSTFSDGTSWSISDCSDVEDADLGAVGPFAATPGEAVTKFVANRKHFPKTGWHVLKHKPTTVEFRSGKDLLLVTKEGTPWTVTEYAICVSG